MIFSKPKDSLLVFEKLHNFSNTKNNNVFNMQIPILH